MFALTAVTWFPICCETSFCKVPPIYRRTILQAPLRTSVCLLMHYAASIRGLSTSTCLEARCYNAMWHIDCVGWSWTHRCRLGPSRQVERMRDQMTIPVQTCPNSPQHPFIHPANVAKKGLCTFIHLLNTHFEGLKQIEIIQELIESHQYQYLTMRNWNSQQPPTLRVFLSPGAIPGRGSALRALRRTPSKPQQTSRFTPPGTSEMHAGRTRKRCHSDSCSCQSCVELWVTDGTSWVDVLQPWSSGVHFPSFWLISVQEYINIHGLEIFY